MHMTACITCGKSVKNKNSIKRNLCQTKVHLKGAGATCGESVTEMK